MNLRTALTIQSNHVNGDILIDTAQYTDTKKWVSQMYLMRDGHIHTMLLSFDRNENFDGWETQSEALKAMEKIRDEATDYVEALEKTRDQPQYHNGYIIH